MCACRSKKRPKRDTRSSVTRHCARDKGRTTSVSCTGPTTHAHTHTHLPTLTTSPPWPLPLQSAHIQNHGLLLCGCCVVPSCPSLAAGGANTEGYQVRGGVKGKDHLTLYDLYQGANCGCTGCVQRPQEGVVPSGEAAVPHISCQEPVG